jgi:hypothetical protein
MNLRGFRKSLSADSPPAELTPPLRALWHAGRNEWDVAHRIVQDDPRRDAAWVHAHLHRIEGDMANADYWYRQAGRTCPPGGTSEELWDIAAALLRER